MSFVLQRTTFDPLVVSWIGTAIAVSYAAYLTYTTSKKSAAVGGSGGGGAGQINPGIKKDTPKVVDNIDVEDLGNKAVFCRCWRSKKFPYCDGSHAKHNEATGDNVGPLIIQDSKGPK
jgi:CDGSH-type Zn-finger protein